MVLTFTTEVPYVRNCVPLSLALLMVASVHAAAADSFYDLLGWGHGSLPVRWSAIQALLASYSGASIWMARFSVFSYSPRSLAA